MNKRGIEDLIALREREQNVFDVALKEQRRTIYEIYENSSDGFDLTEDEMRACDNACFHVLFSLRDKGELQSILYRYKNK